MVSYELYGLHSNDIESARKAIESALDIGFEKRELAYLDGLVWIGSSYRAPSGTANGDSGPSSALLTKSFLASPTR